MQSESLELGYLYCEACMIGGNLREPATKAVSRFGTSYTENVCDYHWKMYVEWNHRMSCDRYTKIKHVEDLDPSRNPYEQVPGQSDDPHGTQADVDLELQEQGDPTSSVSHEVRRERDPVEQSKDVQTVLYLR